jgi:hypothetical protein
MPNSHKLYSSLKENNDYVSKLEILPKQRSQLMAARLIVRNHLRDSFRKHARSALREAVDSGVRIRIGERAAEKLADITPKFLTQGSFGYKTINAPWQQPQQMDLDDGMYLPMSFMEQTRPSIASKALFTFVDGALAELLKVHPTWRFIQKPTCARIVLDAHSHIDVPLYAIPDDDYVTMAKGVEARADMALDSAFNLSESLNRRDSWTLLPSDKVLLAIRGSDWKVSDPRLIANWFSDEIELRGEGLRRAIRFVKGWRDFNWGDSSLPSVAIMACVAKAFKLMDAVAKDRDDQNLAKVFGQLPDLLSDPIYNPADPANLNDRFDAKLTDDHRRELQTKARDAGTKLAQAIADTNCELANDKLRVVYGSRFPYRPDEMKQSVATTILAHEAKTQPMPKVRATTAG